MVLEFGSHNAYICALSLFFNVDPDRSVCNQLSGSYEAVRQVNKRNGTMSETERTWHCSCSLKREL